MEKFWEILGNSIKMYMLKEVLSENSEYNKYINEYLDYEPDVLDDLNDVLYTLKEDIERIEEDLVFGIESYIEDLEEDKNE